MQNHRKIFVPHKLETIEVDVQKKIFRVNGEDFGGECTGFNIECVPGTFQIRMEIDTTVHLIGYDKNGEKASQKKYKTNDPQYTGGQLP